MGFFNEAWNTVGPGAFGKEGLFGKMFGSPGDPYKEAMEPINQGYSEGIGYQNPFYQYGQKAMPQYESWLGGMRNPSQFINQQMGGYQESPWAKYQQQQMMRSAQNMGSAEGLTGSTPLMQFAQENARNLSSQDQNQWLQHVLGVNRLYGTGLQGQLDMGQNAGNMMSNLAMNRGQDFAKLRHGQEAGDQQSLWSNLGNIAGLGQLAMAFL